MTKRIIHLLIGFTSGGLIVGSLVARLWGNYWSPAIFFGCLLLVLTLLITSLQEDGHL